MLKQNHFLAVLLASICLVNDVQSELRKYLSLLVFQFIFYFLSIQDYVWIYHYSY